MEATEKSHPKGQKKDDEEPSYVEAIEELAGVCYETYPDAPWLSLSEFSRRSEQEEWIIVDVRPQREQNVSTIPGALNDKEFKARIKNRTGERGKQILVYCTAGCRSARYARKLQKQGFKAFNLRGGILAWALDGRMFVTPGGEFVRRAHVCTREWNVLPPDYEAVF